MPRIAAALAACLTVVTCVGFNTARYPVVWEMAAPPDGLVQSRRSASAAPVPQSPDAPQSETPTPTAPTASPGDRAASWELHASPHDDSATAWASTTAAPDSPYAGDNDEGSSYAEDDSICAEDGSSYTNDYAASNANQDEGESYGDYPSYADDGSRYANDYSSYGDGSSSYGGSSSADESSSDADEHSPSAYEGSSRASGYASSTGTEDEPPGYDDGPAERVAMRRRPERINAGAGATVSGYPVDPVAPLGGAARPWASDDRFAGDAGDVAQESGNQPVRATAAECASYPSQTPASSADTVASAYSFSTGDALERPSAGPTDAPSPDDGLVPVKPAGTPRDASGASVGPSASGTRVAVGSGSRGGTSRVERLPPVDQMAASGGASPEPLGPNEPTPVYRSTGVE